MIDYELIFPMPKKNMSNFHTTFFPETSDFNYLETERSDYIPIQNNSNNQPSTKC